MPQQPLYTIREGVSRIAALHAEAEEKPFLAAVFGQQHAGKTHFCGEVIGDFEARGLYAGYTTNTEFDDPLQSVYAQLECLLIESGINSLTADQTDVAILNMNIAHYTGGREVEVTVFVYNPSFKPQPDLGRLFRDFDMFVCNPDSELKKLRKK